MVHSLCPHRSRARFSHRPLGWASAGAPHPPGFPKITQKENRGMRESSKCPKSRIAIYLLLPSDSNLRATTILLRKCKTHTRFTHENNPGGNGPKCSLRLFWVINIYKSNLKKKWRHWGRVVCLASLRGGGRGEPLDLLFKSHKFILMNGHCSCCLKISLKDKKRKRNKCCDSLSVIWNTNEIF